MAPGVILQMEAFIMELNLARLVYDQAQAPDSKPIPHLERIAVALPNAAADANDAVLNEVEAAIEREGYLVQVMA